MVPERSLSHLGPYEILSLIGAGGMGKVYKASDTRLGREVAVKVLTQPFTADPERIARLQREAHILASLNHPNIASIYSLEDSHGVRGLVMEYVEGPTLAERVERGPIPLDEAMPIARQVAEALHFAHERGIIHRDLKPANVKVATDGTVKVLDFGLAKAMEGESPVGDPAVSPTLTLGATRAGIILGTAAYMSPEQARGMPADKRADVWAFGVVLFEMLTGKRLFTGEVVSDTLASVLKQPIDWSPLPVSTAPPVRRLLRRCLERDPKKRLQDMGDALLEIEEAVEQGPEHLPTSSRRRAILPWVIAVSLAVCLGVVALRRPSPPAKPLMRLDLELGPNAALSSFWGGDAVLSRDGKLLVYLARGPDGKTQLAARRLDMREATLLAGTEGARQPFLSPDGRWIGFFANSQVKKIAVTGGTVVVLGDAGNSAGGSWGEDGTIVAALRLFGGLSKLSAVGGPAQPLTELDRANGELSHRRPQILPGGQAVMFTAGGLANMEETSSIVVQSLTDKRRKVLRRGGYYGRYSPSGHLAFVQRGTLYAVRFDPSSWEVMGAPVPIGEQVASSGVTGSAVFDVSHTGTLIYATGNTGGGNRSLTWLDAAGKLESLPAKPGNYGNPRMSPDGKRLLLTRAEANAQGVWVYDWHRHVLSRVDDTPVPAVWSAEGEHIVLGSLSGEIRWIRADGSGTGKYLTTGHNVPTPFSVSPDNRMLAFGDVGADTAADIWMLPLEGGDTDDPRPGKPEPFLRTRSSEWGPAFSPDGRWLAYMSNDSGEHQVYVRPFPSREARWLVSTESGAYPVWSRSRPELFYMALDGRIMVVAYSVKGDTFFPQAPRLWSEHRVIPSPFSPSFDVRPGNGLIALVPPPEMHMTPPPTRLTFVLNFFDDLQRRVPSE